MVLAKKMFPIVFIPDNCMQENKCFILVLKISSTDINFLNILFISFYYFFFNNGILFKKKNTAQVTENMSCYFRKHNNHYVRNIKA